MTVTKASNCASFTITSDLIDAWVADNTIELTLNVYKNCAIEPIELEAGDVDSGSTLIVTAASLDQTSILADDIYVLELVSVDGDTTETEVYCLFINCDTKCRIITYLADNLNSNIYHLYQVLNDGEVCTDADCANACVIFNEISRLLDDSNTLPCGCS
jgi:hypothetical protein